MRIGLGIVVLLFFPLVAVAGDITAARTLRPGTVIADGDLQAEPQDMAQAQSMIGMEIKRAIYTGMPITMADLGPPTVVQRNEHVVMVYRQGALGIRTEGRALESGAVGEGVQVMNLSSHLTVRAVVTGPRQVEVFR